MEITNIKFSKTFSIFIIILLLPILMVIIPFYSSHFSILLDKRKLNNLINKAQQQLKTSEFQDENFLKCVQDRVRHSAEQSYYHSLEARQYAAKTKNIGDYVIGDIKYLNCKQEITDLSGISQLTGLHSLTIQPHNMINLLPLADNSSIQSLTLNSNDPNALYSIEGLNSMKYLNTIRIPNNLPHVLCENLYTALKKYKLNNMYDYITCKKDNSGILITLEKFKTEYNNNIIVSKLREFDINSKIVDRNLFKCARQRVSGIITSNVKYKDVIDNNIEDVKKQITSLHCIDIDSLEGIDELSNLSELTLSFNKKIESIDFSDLKNNMFITVLELYGNSRKGYSFSSIAGIDEIPSLQRLKLPRSMSNTLCKDIARVTNHLNLDTNFYCLNSSDEPIRYPEYIDGTSN